MDLTNILANKNINLLLVIGMVVSSEAYRDVVSSFMSDGNKDYEGRKEKCGLI